MIVNTFKTNQIYIYAFIPVVLAVLGFGNLNPAFRFEIHGQFSFVGLWFQKLLAFPVWSFVLSLLIITWQSFLLSKTCEENRLMPYSTNFPAFFLALNYAVFAWPVYFSPVMMANLFVVLALRKILFVYNQKRIDGNLFRAGIYISVASIFYMPCLLFLPVFIYHIWLSRPIAWREWTIPFIGLITPYLYVVLYYLFTDGLSDYFDAIITAAVYYTGSGRQFMELVPVIANVILVISALIYLPLTDNRRTVRINNLYKVLFVSMVLVALAAFIQADDKTSFLILLIPSISIMQAYFVLGIERTWLREGSVYLIVILVLLRMF